METKFLKIIYQAVVTISMAFVGTIACELFHIGYWAAPMVAFVTCALLGALITGVFETSEHEDNCRQIEQQRYKSAA